MSTATTDPERIHHVHHDGTDGPLSDTLVDAVAALADTDPEDLPPLDSRINVAALDGLWNTAGDERPPDGCLTFTYGGFAVVVRSTGTVFLRETE
ncbi:HalOD1 output domain-containing protein [Haloplanus salinarum]|uniref:HalOD1 output domain-containing protein n=1 Tax=Haloplanus salinarum TaxID=1912324 RepID=UPI00214C9636|nr:HalOD1 output domain-containing protein [Haloplanus salinarum]